jgi:large subunit ribosomal protein L3
MGADQVTVKNLNVIDVDAEKHTVIVTGAVPGAPGTYVVIRKAVSPRRRSSQVGENVTKKKGK